MLSQNAIRNRKNIRPASLAAYAAAAVPNLAGGVESCVRGTGKFFSIIEQNMPQIFDQLDKVEFTKNLNERARWRALLR
jgi:hypothetical protein